jgi:hypothetical protein
MKKFLKRSLKTTLAYGAGVFLFTFFLIAPISMENNRNTWIAVYSFVFFVFTCIFLYKQMWKEGSLEKREYGNLTPPWYKGVFYALAGFSPFLLLEILYFLIYPVIDGSFGANVFHVIFRCGFGPMYFIIRLLGYKWYAYLISSVIIPIIAIAGYVAGTMETGIKNIIAERRREEEDFLS